MSKLETYTDIEKAINKEFVMIIAKSKTCTACASIDMTLERNVPNIGEIEKYHVYIDEMDKFRGDHLIFSVPTVLIFSNGKELLRESRYIDYSKIERLIMMYQ